ncbi:MAG TPA: DPP IV N-terminal domain-containing protein [Gemmatimonadaceae bacterium]
MATPRILTRSTSLSLLALASAAGIVASPARAQDRLQSMLEYPRYHKLSGEISGSVTSAAIKPVWVDTGKAFDYEFDGKRYHYDVARRAATLTGAVDTQAELAALRARFAAGPGRGRQFESAISPDGKLKAVYRGRNLWLSDVSGNNEIALTTDGSVPNRIKNGTASWVYGEELGQRTAMWWSPDGSKIAYYRFDESKVPDYYIAVNQTRVHDTLDVEAFPQPGVPNPVVDLFVYDVARKTTTRVDVRDGQPFDNSVVGEYVYHVAWTHDGRELTFNRTNRKQNILEFAACDPSSGKCRAIVRDEWPASWVENNPEMTYLSDGRRFIWESERNGFRNYYLYDLSGKLLVTLTNNQFDAGNIARVDEKGGVLYYTAHDGDNSMKMQLHRVGLNGRSDRRLTNPAFSHTISFSPDGKHFVDVAQTHDEPPVARLMDADGKPLAEIAKSDVTKFDELGLKHVELFSYKAGDGTTVLNGMLHFPSNFDPHKRYPLLVSVYGGPNTNGASENFTLPNRLTELGFLVATLDSRSADGRGKHFLDAIYEKLGIVEIDDQAAGVRALDARPYVDKSRVGIFGTSYGGYASLMALLRYPDLFAAACSMSPPTDWRNYDTIYTERYMWIPQENEAGYDAGSAMTYASNLRGRLMLYYGTADNNVHNSNSMQMVAALQKAGKSFDVQVGPDQGHSALNADRMMEFFIQNLPAPTEGSVASH